MRFNNLILTVLILNFLPNIFIAQETGLSYSITAKVLNADHLPIDIGNVLILASSDSALIGGDVFYDGEFIVNNITTPHFIVKITALGFEDYYQQIQMKEISTKLESIILTNTSLDEIVINSQRQIIEKKGANIIMNVAHTSLSDAGTVKDVLQNAPKVDINRNGQISILGKGVASVFIDGQQVASSQILSSLSSIEVSKIEIMENPPASFDAAGNAVINIVTKSKTLEGYKLGLTQEVGYGKYFRSFFQINSYLKIKDFMVQGDYGIRPQTIGNRFRQARNFQSDVDPYFTDNHYLLENKWLGHNYSLRMAYKFTNGISVGLNYNGTNSVSDKKGDNHRIGDSAGESLLDIATLVTGITGQNSNTATLYLKSDSEKDLTYQLQGQYSDFGLNRNELSDQKIESTKGTDQLLRKSKNTNDISIYTLQVDFQKKINQNLKVEWGGKTVSISNSSFVGFDDILENGTEVPLQDFTNDFKYQENILASYVQGHWNSNNKYSLTAGIRGEWTRAYSSTDEFINGALERNYFNIFPSASIQYSLSEDIKTSLSYSYRINRPLFQDLNPYVLYVDSLVSLRGNAFLVPEYSHSVTSNLNYKNWSVDLTYVRTINKINQIFRSLNADNPNVISFVKENINYTDLIMLSASGQLSYKKYNAYISIGGFYDNHDVQNINSALANDRFGYYIQVNQNIDLPWGLNLGSYARYISARVDGVYIDDPMSYVNLTLSKKFIKDQLTVRLWYNDVLDDWRFTGVSDFNNMHMDYLSEGDWNFIKISLNWSFGKLNASGMNRNKISQDELKRISGGM